ncbi:MAG: sugar phosphate nucleotidyltransferase, partial [Rhodospirillales bacterium]|nr:sugar phosphate nucleotidyltransferase [Rhodospirillales bacterium]
MSGMPIQPLDAVLARFSVRPDAPMRDALAFIERNGEGVVLVLDDDRRLVGIVTDGDIRRAILDNRDVTTTPVGDFLGHKPGRVWKKPLTAPVDLAEADLVRLMTVRLVRHMPLVDGDGRVVGLALLEHLSKPVDAPLHAVVMAGGFGSRMRPLTEDTPKPLLEVGHKPVIDHIVDQLRQAGVRNVSVTTHFHAEKIRRHLGDGSEFGIDVRYAHEETPLGTAGALAALRGGKEPLLVINGDILTAVDFRAMHHFHREQHSDITVGVRRYEVKVPFGVLEVEDTAVRQLVEKPSYSLFINAGIYLLEPAMLDLIPTDRRFDMTDLIQLRLDGGGTVTS